MSGFNNCNYITLDGFGDFISTSIGYFKNQEFHKLNEVQFSFNGYILHSHNTIFRF